MGIGTLRQYHGQTASALMPEPDFRELYKAAQKQIDALSTENALLRADLEAFREPTTPAAEEPLAEPSAGDEPTSPTPRRRR